MSRNETDLMFQLILYLNRTKENWTLDDYIELTRGSKYLPIVIVLPITIIYVIIFFTGIIGNTLVCWVIIKHKMMHSATNYYLFSLAVSDLMLLILGLPNDLSVYWQQYPWQFGESLCKIRALASEMSSYTSVLTIVAFTMERYIAICHPLYSYTMSSLARVLKIIVAAWTISLFCALPFAVYTTVNYIDYPPHSGNILEESAFCAMLESNIPEWLPIYELSTIMFLIIPIIIIVILYTKIAMKLRERNDYSLGTRLEGSVHSRKSHSQRKPIIRMLVAVVSMFFICWAPFHAQRLIYLYGKSWPNYVTLNEWMYYITGALYFFSSTVNPILYNLMSVKYRKAFKQTLFGGRNVNKRGHQSSFRESSQGAAEISDEAQKNSNKCISREKVQSDTIVRVNNSNSVTNGNCVLTVKTGFFPKNLFILPPNPVTNKEQGRSALKGVTTVFISNQNAAKETYI